MPTERTLPLQKTAVSGRPRTSTICPPTNGPMAKPTGPMAPKTALTVPIRPRGATSRRAASMTPVLPSWRPVSSSAAASCQGSAASATPAKTTASTTALRTITARRLILSAHTPQNGTRKMPNTKMSAVKRPVSGITCSGAIPTSCRRSGRNAKTWLTPIASTSEVAQ